jgi:hypothetical protein
VRCGAIEECSATDPAVACPVSSRKFKSGIEYVDESGLNELHDETLAIRLATYNYRPQVADPSAKHLGFIIEDAPVRSPAVDSSHDRVDIYGYLSMVVATTQVQEREIAELRRQLELAQHGICAAP